VINSNAVQRFVERINAHDASGLVALMTADHVFVDSLGTRLLRPAIEKGWEEYFAMVPDYWVRIDRTISDGETSVLLGEAGGTFVPGGGMMNARNEWRTPAVWVARIRDEKVWEWRIYSDNEPIREKMRLASP